MPGVSASSDVHHGRAARLMLTVAEDDYLTMDSHAKLPKG